MDDIEKQLQEAEEAINHVYEVMRQIIHKDLKTKSKDEIITSIGEAGFDTDSFNTLYNYCLEREDYEACEILKAFHQSP